jgi:hypothetical protein
VRIRACCVVGRGAITALTAVLAPGGRVCGRCCTVMRVPAGGLPCCCCCSCSTQRSHLLSTAQCVSSHPTSLKPLPLPPSPHPSASHNLQPVSPPLVGQADPRTLDRRLYPPSPSCTWQICSRLCTSPHSPITNSAPSRNRPRLPLRDPDRQCL